MKHLVAVNCGELQEPELLTAIVFAVCTKDDTVIFDTIANLLDSEIGGDSGIMAEAYYDDVSKIYGKVRSAISRIDDLSDQELVEVYPVDDFMVVETNEIGNNQ